MTYGPHDLPPPPPPPPPPVDPPFDPCADGQDEGWPWSFILLVVAGALYLIFRFVQLGVELLT